MNVFIKKWTVHEIWPDDLKGRRKKWFQTITEYNQNNKQRVIVTKGEQHVTQNILITPKKFITADIFFIKYDQM